MTSATYKGYHDGSENRAITILFDLGEPERTRVLRELRDLLGKFGSTEDVGMGVVALHIRPDGALKAVA